MPTQTLPIAFASNDADEIKKVLRVLSLRVNLEGMGTGLRSPSTHEFETAVDGMMVKGVVTKVQPYSTPAYHIGFTESDIDELIGDYISDKAGVPVFDTTKRSDNTKVTKIFGNAVNPPQTQPQPAQKKRTSPTQNKLDTVLKAMPNDSFIQSLDQQYKRKGRLTRNQQSALQKIYDRVINPSSVQVDPQLVARLDALVKAMPRDRFVKSLKDQYTQRGSLSPKQMSAMEKLEKGVASGGDQALIKRLDELLSVTTKIKGRKRTLVKSFKDQVVIGRSLSQRQLELVEQYEQVAGIR